MAEKRLPKAAESRANAEEVAPRTPRLRLKLSTIDDVKAELARLYKEGKAGTRDVSDVSKLGHVLGMLGRLIVDHEFDARIAALEERNAPGRRK